jgi:hypothetical protein
VVLPIAVPCDLRTRDAAHSWRAGTPDAEACPAAVDTVQASAASRAVASGSAARATGADHQASAAATNPDMPDAAASEDDQAEKFPGALMLRRQQRHHLPRPPVVAEAEPNVRRAALDVERPAARASSGAVASAWSDAVPRFGGGSSAGRCGRAQRAWAAPLVPPGPRQSERRAPVPRPALRPEPAVRAAVRPARRPLPPPRVPAQAPAPRREAAEASLRRPVQPRPAQRQRRASPSSPDVAAGGQGPPASAARAPFSRVPASCPSERASPRRCRRLAA